MNPEDDFEHARKRMIDIVRLKTGLAIEDAKLENGHWLVLVTGYGWKSTTNALKGELR